MLLSIYRYEMYMLYLGFGPFGRHGEIEKNHVRRFDYSPVNIISIQGSGLM